MSIWKHNFIMWIENPSQETSYGNNVLKNSSENKTIWKETTIYKLSEVKLYMNDDWMVL